MSILIIPLDARGKLRSRIDIKIYIEAGTPFYSLQPIIRTVDIWLDMLGEFIAKISRLSNEIEVLCLNDTDAVDMK